ncbi:hypothetical protein Tco_0586948 [Tanacetum coccineum]
MTYALTRSGLIRSFQLKATATTFAFPRWCGRRCPILNCFNLSGVNVNSLIVNHVYEKLHDTDPEITFGELGIQFLLFEKLDDYSQVASSGWSFVSAVPGLVTHLAANLTLDMHVRVQAGCYLLQQGKVPSIPTILVGVAA